MLWFDLIALMNSWEFITQDMFKQNLTELCYGGRRIFTLIGKLFKHKRSSNQSQKTTEAQREQYKNDELTGKLAKDVQQLKTIFDRSSDVIYREFHLGDKKGTLIFIDGLVNSELIDANVIKPLLKCGRNQVEFPRLEELKRFFLEQVIIAGDIKQGLKVGEAVNHLLMGDTILLIDGMEQAFFISLKKWEKRSVDEPQTELVVRGPREGFTEDIRTNTSLVRRRLKTPSLKMESLTIGKLSQTIVVITYLDGLADASLVHEVRERLNRIDIDAILESGYIEELITDNPFSIFPQIAFTERPDRVVGSILEGEVAILIDNTPFCLITPQTFFQLLQTPEDYYLPYPIATFNRWIRFLFLLISLLLPSLYIALTTFHQEMIPTNLLISVAASREAVPFPALIEAFIMEISFEGLREAGLRMPKAVGQAVSIVGALVIGQAAVEAGIVSSPMVIIVSLTGIAAFVLPNYSLANAIRLLRFPMMLLAGSLGFYGILLGAITLQIHISRLRSFGVPYFTPVGPMDVNSLKDVIIRAPWWSMVKRPGLGNSQNMQRMKKSMRPGPVNHKK